jgi:cholesterol transport system auxiliary component
MVMLAMAGCTVLSPVDIETTKALITKLPPDLAPRLPQLKTRAATLLVLPPETRPIYDTTQMAYTVRPYQIDYFSRNEWGATPSQMLQPLLVQTLENSHAFSAVLVPPYSGSYNYVLRTEILELTQDFTSEPAALQLTLRFQLNNGTSNRLIASKEISLREPMQQKTPHAGVVAANDAVAKALREAASFVLDKTQ